MDTEMEMIERKMIVLESTEQRSNMWLAWVCKKWPQKVEPPK